jgi:hypothetical protein
MDNEDFRVDKFFCSDESSGHGDGVFHDGNNPPVAVTVREYVKLEMDQGGIITPEMIIAYCERRGIRPSVTRAVIERLVRHGVLNKMHISIRW